jgi:hypothetical protein
MSRNPTHVVQAENELANALSLGSTDRQVAARKVLAAAADTDGAFAAAARRASAAAESADDEGAARHTAPQGRTAPPRQTTAADEPDGTKKQIREWAAKAGLTVSARGPIPEEVSAAYHQAHQREE